MSPTRLTIALLLLLGTTSLFAQASRTYVSGVGDDANPCSRTAPCKSFAGTITKTADGGEIDVLDTASFGGVTITKGIRIDGRGALGALTNSTITVNTSEKVELANLSFNGVGGPSVGINVIAAGSLLIDNCDLAGYGAAAVWISTTTSTPVTINNSRIHHDNPGASGLYATTSAGTLRLTVTNSLFSNLTNYGLWVIGSGTLLTLDHTTMANCMTGVRVDGAVVNISNSTIVQSSSYGIYSASTAGLIRVYGSFIQDNSSGGYFVSGSSVIQTATNNSIQGGAGNMLQPINMQ